MAAVGAVQLGGTKPAAALIVSDCLELPYYSGMARSRNGQKQTFRKHTHTTIPHQHPEASNTVTYRKER